MMPAYTWAAGFRQAGLLAALTAATIGCVPQPSVPVLPGPEVTSTPVPARTNPTPPPEPDRTINKEGQYPLGGARLHVVARDPANRAGLPGAKISVIGPGVGFDTSNSAGEATIGPLPLGTYDVRVESAGRLPAVQTKVLDVARQRFDLTIDVLPAERTLTGKVRDSSGRPLAGARIALGQSWTTSGADGAFSLPAAATGEADVRKTGYQSARTAGGDVTLAAEAPPRISFENGPLGTSAASAFSTMRAHLGLAGWTVADGDATAQVRVWAAPQDVSQPQAAAAKAFVASGGKLVVLGEWGGAAGYSPTATNRLLVPLGVSVEANLVRDPSSQHAKPEWLSPVITAGAPGTAGITALTMLGAATVQAAPPSFGMASAPATGYRVQAAEYDRVVAVMRQVGSGLAVAIGDTSAFLDSDIGRADNLSFIRNVLLW
ncbi:MAG: carboxypeptidase regulatory-like domain-containing protein [Candidatus Sericytochromatia bacterium]|uniref:Carboxypeptidase regulatory-like domain-containing protein n=1 Tax=Candidatus Tanganyikabacteria bacterium TaxID=2961651 RepID=A0A937X5K4_9BACT|nr:carboxypeptidase regulatory-like domain-containing protein [Candidatus Tanganyikabacteria bacterium]